MIEMNKTEVAGFVFLEFQSLPNINPLLFSIFLVVYTLTLMGNVTIIALLVLVPGLNSPMYFFLSQLSVTDLLLSTVITPNMLRVVMNGGGTISVAGCVTQFYLFSVSAISECLLLTVMSYDRYVAICDPLHYTSIMDRTLQLRLVLSIWLFAFMYVLLYVFIFLNLDFCGPRIIDHYFWDFAPLLELCCSDVTIYEIISMVSTIIIVIVPFCFVMFTYISIFITIFNIPSNVAKQKAFSTCSSHLIAVSMYYGTLMIIYMAPSKGQLLNLNKMISILYTMGTPFLNPVIYSLRNQEIKRAVLTCILRSLLKDKVSRATR